MKKIIVAFDGLKFSESTKDYAIYLAKRINAHLVGVFLDDFTYHSYSFPDVVGFGNKWEEKIDDINAEDEERRKRSVYLFEDACQAAGLHYSVHRDKNIAYQELIHESIYSDLLIIHSHETFTHFTEPAPTRFLRDVLSDVQCPVIVVPYVYKPISKVILLYDGDPSSVHAVKMLSYIFPNLKHLDTEVLSVKNEKQSMHLPDNRLMKEFMKRHFPDAKYQVEKGDPEEQITIYLETQGEEVLVVLGAYDRSRVSRWFKKSMADHLLANVNVPLFIAHNK